MQVQASTVASRRNKILTTGPRPTQTLPKTALVEIPNPLLQQNPYNDSFGGLFVSLPQALPTQAKFKEIKTYIWWMISNIMVKKNDNKTASKKAVMTTKDYICRCILN